MLEFKSLGSWILHKSTNHLQKYNLVKNPMYSFLKGVKIPFKEKIIAKAVDDQFLSHNYFYVCLI